MMMDFFKKISKREELEDLDTGYDSDYYGGAYAPQSAPERPVSAPVEKRYDERYDERYDQHFDDRYDDRYERDMYNRDRASYDEDDTRFYRDTYAQPVAVAAEPEVEEEVTPVNAGTLYYTPETYRDCREAIVSGLAESHVVVVNMKNLDVSETVRLFDYVMGAVLALEADMTRLNNTTLLLAPKDVEVTEDDLRSLFTAKADTAEVEENSEEEEDDFIGYDDLPDEDDLI